MGFEVEMRNRLASVIEVLQKNNHPINTVYDIGANKGSWVKHYEEILPNSHFVCFEANSAWPKPKIIRSTHEWHHSVLTKPGVDFVEFYNRKGTGDSYYKEDTTFYDGIDGVKVPATTLDNLVLSKSMKKPDLIKMDTQGSEIDILEGAKETIKDTAVIQIEVSVLEYNKGAPNFYDYINYMIDIGFLPIGIEDVHLNDNILMQFDVVFMRKELKFKYYGNAGFWKGLPK